LGAKKANNQDLTQGSLFKYLFTLGLPVMAGLLMNNLYTLTDLYWLGRLGTTAVAAVTLCQILFFVILSISQAFGMGTLAIISRAFGKKEMGNATAVFRNAVFIAGLTGAVLASLIFIFSREVVELLGAGPVLIQPARDYLHPFCIGLAFQLVGMTMNFAIRGTGDMKLPMMIMLVSTTCNIIMDPLMIYGYGPFPEWGIAGAGTATAISQFLAASFALAAVITGRTYMHIPIVLRFRPDWKIIGNILRIGVPAGMQFLILSLSFIFIIRIVAGYGRDVVAAMGIVLRVLHTTSVPVIGLGAAVATLVGQNLGAKLPDRASRATMLGVASGAVFAIIITFTFFTYPTFFVSIFSDAEGVIGIGSKAMRIMAVSQIFTAVSIMFQHCFVGSGDTFPAMLTSAIRAAVLIALALLLPTITEWGVYGVVVCIPASTFIGMVTFIFFYRTGRWKTRMDKLEEVAPAGGVIPS